MPRLESDKNLSSLEDHLPKNYQYARTFIDEHYSVNFEMTIRRDESRRESIFMFSGKKKGYVFASPVSMLQNNPQFINDVNNMWVTWRSQMA